MPMVDEDPTSLSKREIDVWWTEAKTDATEEEMWLCRLSPPVPESTNMVTRNKAKRSRM